MNKLIFALLLCIFPCLALAADPSSSSLSFTPPASDYSVFFLTNLFGIVEGVLTPSGLHGTGSQIMAAMFLVFNSAVLALGGIIIMYTLLVSTMNTAHEGQMLGQKWSSMWIPVRSTLGLGLMMPVSGYCMMQIFVMWVVIQGVGAADKVWDAALSYLNRGGVIIQAQAVNPAAVLLDTSTVGITQAAGTILTGQACMLALEKQLIAQRQYYLSKTENDKGECTSALIKPLCTATIPDFINSVNAVDIQNAKPDGTDFSVQMPNFDPSDKVFSPLNGICGVIKWNAIKEIQNEDYAKTLSPDEFKTAKLSRAIAIQQMYVDLSPIARLMVNNNPLIGTTPDTATSPQGPIPFATQQYGIPKTKDGVACATYTDDCQTWGAAFPEMGVLFNGTEFQLAINDYNGVMKPTLNAIAQINSPDKDIDVANRKFIQAASDKGWIMAGAYFFDLVKLNSASKANASTVDATSGLGDSKIDVSNISVSAYPILANWFPKEGSSYPRLDQIITLLNAGGASAPDFTKIAKMQVVGGEKSTSVFGYLNNAAMMRLPGQPGLSSLLFARTLKFPEPTGRPWPNISTRSGLAGCQLYVGFPFYLGCVDDAIVDAFYNAGVWIANNIGQWVYQTFEDALNQIIYIPLQGIAALFQQGVSTISQPGVNPIVALANMGVMYINFAGSMWITIILTSAITAIAPPVFALLMLALPIIMSWMVIMLGISFITAYYIPILPYMMFLFGAIGWLTSVIEAMVAAPLVALGITHPEGNEAFGKGEHAIMILLNVFLRPAMMIIGYVAAIAMTYVSVWLLNAGFDHAISFMQSSSIDATHTQFVNTTQTQFLPPNANSAAQTPQTPQELTVPLVDYQSYAGLFAYFFSILLYTTLYLIVVQKSFNLISFLPDKVLRWIGGQAESIGQEAAQWGEEAKSSTKEAGTSSQNAMQQTGKQAGAAVQRGVAGAKELGQSVKAEIKAAQNDSKSSGPDKPPGS